LLTCPNRSETVKNLNLSEILKSMHPNVNILEKETGHPIFAQALDHRRAF
jgi:hypothetical protein